MILIHSLVAVAFAADTPITVGQTAMTIPSPPGFVPVTQGMTNLDLLMDTFVGPDNVRLVNFIPEQLASIALSNRVPNLVRYASLQSYKRAVSQTVTSAEFARLKTAIQKQYSELLQKAQKQIPDLMDKINKRMEGKLDSPLSLNVNQTVPFPAHDESDRVLAMSLMMNLAVKLPDGQATNAPVVMTTTLLHIRGKVLFAYVYGDGNDLEWTRQLSKDWAAAIVAANPSDAATATHESMKPGNPESFMERVLGYGLIGAVVGGLIGVLRLFTRRKPSTPSDT